MGNPTVYSKLPLLLFTGMAADERLFEGQREAFENVITPNWIEAIPGESIQDYAKRMVEHVGPVGPCIVGGASFGGVVAQEAAHYLDAKAIILIGSIKGPGELPPLMRMWRFMSYLPEEQARWLIWLAAKTAKPFVPRQTARRMRMMAMPDYRFVRWASMALLRWKPMAPRLNIPVFHIHGDADGTLPVKYTNPDVIIPGGDHIISYRRAGAVNEFIRNSLAIVVEYESHRSKQ